ncbi:hypothetical protein S7711_01007 [Stachybotrys chartarum IBT 7711]|uniref:Uncharacterized protein n=1 Tax=Stachybotrys chartarum (strain CBS 109288 / IBT 7711) TaxID=1280523 RepID=A0A084B446_STACB|nr:hypothetical protein S7711_01007 [Stachybotrys chartarum IBT 7711]
MRTRISNRNKKFTVDKFEFDSSGDENPALAPPSEASDKDANFDETAAADSAEDDDNIPPDQEDSDSEVVPSSKDVGGTTTSRPRKRRVKNFEVKTSQAGFLDIDAIPPDGHVVRGYVGPFDRALRGQNLVEAWYGPRRQRTDIAYAVLERWAPWTVLPPRLPDEDMLKGLRCIWHPEFFEKEEYFAKIWEDQAHDVLHRPYPGRCVLTEEQSLPYRINEARMPVLLGPQAAQRDIEFAPGHGYTLSHNGIPFDDDESEAKTPSGWLFDTGGLVVGMHWARSNDSTSTQILALAVIPHSDQEPYDYQQESANPDFQRYGTVQIWGFSGTASEDNGVMVPAMLPPRLRKTLCLDYGRARRVKWNPALHLLAVLCGDGKVYVVDPGDDDEATFELVQEPIATLALQHEESIKATTMTWININRLVVGYVDGSIGLWSIYPLGLLSRHPIHHSAVVDVASGYPSMPYIISSTPIGGFSRLVDLRAPSYERTEVQAGVINVQPNLLGYSDHLLGFFSHYPSSNIMNTIVGFMHHAHYPLARRVFTADSFLTCLAVGQTHPFLLVGTADGCLWALNPVVELFSPRREPSDRIKIFQHEHRRAAMFSQESPASARGAVRILHGFGADKNRNPRTEVRPPPKKGKKTKKSDAAPAGMNEDDEVAGATLDPSRGVVHEPRTRVTVMEWNPNEGYGCWAAVGMASGLVRVIDLGLTRPP